MGDPVHTPVAIEIRNADYSRLQAILAQTQARIDIASRSVAHMRYIVQQEKPEPIDRRPFDDAFQQVRICEVALRNSIVAASKASPEEAAAAQAQVAANYEAYARAVTVAESMTKAASGGALASNSRLNP